MTWSLACDASYDMPDPAALKAAGYDVVMGYLSRTPGKGLTAAYVQRCADAGILIQPLYETTATMALGGRPAGVAAATIATGIGHDLGCPPDVAIIYALDSDFSTGQMSGAVSAFIDGLHAVPGPDGEYGGYRQLGWLVAHKLDVGRLFQTYAWSGGQWLSAADAPIQQYRNGVHLAGGTVDLCRIDISALTLWNPGGPTMTAADTTKATFQTDGVLKNYAWRPDATSNPTITAESLIREGGDEAHAANVQSKANAATLAGIVKTEAAIQATLAALVTGGTSVDTAALAAQIKAIGDQESAAVAGLHQQIADLRAALAASVTAEASALNGGAA